MMVWLIRQPDGRVVLMDAGFYRDKFMQQWKPTTTRARQRQYVQPACSQRT